MASTILEPGQIEAAAGTPPFIRVPEKDLFAKRAKRLRDLAEQHPLQAYLQLIAEIAQAQQKILDDKVAVDGPSAADCARSIEHAMPPLAFETLVRGDSWLPVVDELVKQLEHLRNPAVEQALQALRDADKGQRKAWGMALLSGQFDLLPAGLVPFLGAALQVAFSQWQQGIDTDAITERGASLQCPVCGSPPVAGIIEHSGRLNGLRFLHCSLCSSQWHFVRIKCSHCEDSKRLRYISLEDDKEAEKRLIRAEACPNCDSYLKQFYLEFDEHAEPVADDLASLALDILLSDEGYLRHAPNLLLAPGPDK